MTRAPGPPLDARERALLAALPPLQGRGQPDGGLDARILAAAADAQVTSRPGPRRQRRWVTPLGVAATVIVAGGLAWQLLPPTAPVKEHDVGAAPAQAETAQATTPPPLTPATVPDVAVAPQPEAAAPAVAASRRVAKSVAAPSAKPVAEAATSVSPPAPPAPGVASPAQAGSLPPAPVLDSAAAKVTAAGTNAGRTRESAPLASPARQDMPAAQAPVEHTPAPAQRVAASVPREAPLADDDVPPATVDAPGVRDAWLQRIAELMAEGRSEEARKSLEVFRKRYPDAVLPPELRALEPPPSGG